MNRPWSSQTRRFALAAGIFVLATSNITFGFLRKSLAHTQSQAQSHKRPNESNPYHVQFRDVTREAGIHFHHERAQSPQRLYPETMGAGVGWIDYDQDGYLDAFFVNSGYTPNFHPAQPPQPALYHNNRDGTFTDVTAASKIHTDGTMFFGVAVGDYDNDGFPDIYMTGYRHSVLLHNNGDGTFTDVTAKAGVGNDGNWGTAAGWFDYDNDGKLDLLVTNYVQYDVDHPVVCGDWRPGAREAPKVSAYCHPDNFPGTSPRLYRNNGDGTFVDVTEKAGLTNKDGKSLAVVLVDLNNDGLPDIFIGNDTQRNFVYINKGDGTFRDASYTSGAGFSEDGRAEAGMSADAADIMNNGLPYLFVSHLDFELNRLYRNNGDGTFTDYTIASGVGQSDILNSAFGARFFDLDNDGWRDLLVINGHILDNIKLYHPEVSYEEEKKLYRNIGEGRFVDATNSQGADFRAPRVGRGLAVGDYDNDGWQDFLVSNNGEDAQLFHNDGGSVTAPAASIAPEKRSPSDDVANGAVAPGAPPFDSRKREASEPSASVPRTESRDRGVMDLRKGKDKVLSFDDSDSAPQKNHWLAIRLVGTKSNRDGIGAHLKLVAGDLTSYDQSKGGMSYCSAQDPRIFFGLGEHARVDSLEIWWPSGLRESLTNLPVDVFLTIEEGAGTAKAVRYPPIKRK
ncbi:MAG: CRTAC1 family protein [Candidatus Acidiferrales bacterium]